ncbi:MAG TPA: PAS domain-containing protein, partial [Planctomycetota bacterium]|nr:PAS domain-containing protein [Planctomycetota bacterium]
MTEFLAAGALDSAFGDALTVTLEEGREQEAGRITDLIHGDVGHVFNVYLKPIDYEGVRQILIVAEDATEVEQSLNEAFHERAKLQELVNAIGVSVIMVETDSALVWSNKIFEDNFGEKSPEQGRRAFWNALKNQDQVLESCFRSGKSRSVQFKYIDPDGFPKHCTHYLAPISDKERRRTQVMIVTQDTTAQARRAEQ